VRRSSPGQLAGSEIDDVITGHNPIRHELKPPAGGEASPARGLGERGDRLRRRTVSIQQVDRRWIVLERFDQGMELIRGRAEKCSWLGRMRLV
jgi:hypothetical protein